ncbi:MAG: PAS domain-containing protein [Actinomycetota bacterium]
MSGGRTLRTIIVEDREDDAELMVHELRRAGFEPEWRRVETVREFLAALEQDEPEVVLCDFSLPEINAIRAVQLLAETGRPVPLIIVSGTIGEESAVSAMHAGAVDYVLKDRLGRLGEAVRLALARRSDEERRILAEAALREAEAKYRTLIEQTPAIVYTWGIVGTPPRFTELYVSPSVTDVLGFEPEDWLADPLLWLDRLHPDDRERVIADTTACAEAGRPFEIEYRMFAKDGRVVWMHDRAAVTARDDEGKTTRYQGVMLDITARKSAEDEQRRSEEQIRELDRQRRDLLSRVVTIQDEERRRIAADVHDDLIQELVALGYRATTLAKRHPDIEEDESFRAIQRGVGKGISRLRHLVFELHPRTLDTSGIESTLRIHLDQLQEESETPEYVLHSRIVREPAPPTRATMYRIAREAIANARRHADAEHVGVSLAQGDDGYTITITDDGAGFDVEAPLTSEAGHLGLSSMRERAELAGGWIGIDSAPGNGTTVTCGLPDLSPEADDSDA